MEARRIAVFSTTDLQSEDPRYPGQEPVYRETFEGRALAWFSTRRLETAIALGYEVYVCSIRPAFGPQDDWWRRQVDPANVFCAMEALRFIGTMDSETLFMKPWQRLYKRLGVRWDGFGDVAQARDALARDARVIDGRTFNAMQSAS